MNLHLPLKSLSKDFIFCRYSSHDFLNGFRKSYFWKHPTVIAFDNINFESIIIVSYLTEPVDYCNKATKISATMIHYWEISVKYLEEIAVGLVRLKKPSWNKFCKLWQICRSVWIQVFENTEAVTQRYS